MNHIQITASFGSLDLQVDASFANQFIIVSGENGAGKTSLLRCLAGLESPRGMLQLGDKIWLDSSAGFNLPAQQRQLGCVWPDAALLPWLSVEKNIVFGADAVNSQWLLALATQFEITALMQRQPCMLSTGEMQRVSLARSLYRKPAVLLLDEPFSAQAPAIRQRLRLCLKGLQAELAIPVLMVSHDGADARILAQQHWHMRAGKLLLSLADMQESSRKNKGGKR
ncbi:MAG: ATP-binding cassette domain-containing protein [Mariprofundus sp.]|nr:ATP-binding cassette domain-containing protein [Mariprofundus sp.]